MGSDKSPQVEELNPPPPTLLSTRHRKKQADHDSQLIANRIALLKKEELRALKKIEKTNARAKEIINLRKENEKKIQVGVCGATRQARDARSKRRGQHK